ncbi:hypothetical protein G7Y89_g3750 [Cudoniella acicularis]|uniref:Uncharacterized protein n=1 Tax=Cudoniella acicularis TaxID=354080 RepID=A0A8H4RSM6_9HELO|nr:hypothetical protein G7Y89_g3750 [Cudoniella acicularis]
MASHARPPLMETTESTMQVIDLTQCDDEENKVPTGRLYPNDTLEALRIVQNLPVSHDGLPTTFDFGPQSAHNRREEYNLNFAPPRPNSIARTSGPASVATRFPAAAQNPAPRIHTSGPVSKRRSSRELLTRDPNSANQNGIYGEGNAAKRRKTHGGMTLRDKVLATTSPSELPNQHPRSKMKTQSLSSKARVPPPKPLVKDAPLGLKSSRQDQKTIASKNGLSRLVRNRLKHEMSLRILLLDQLFPYIRSAIAGTITRDQRFIKNMISNGLALSPAYERMLPSLLSPLASKFIKETLNLPQDFSDQSLLRPNEIASNYASQELSERSETSSNSSKHSEDEDEAEIFEGRTPVPKISVFPHRGMELRTHSSSPTTSFSTDHVESTNGGDGEQTEKSIAAETQLQSSRSLRPRTKSLPTRLVVMIRGKASIPSQALPDQKATQTQAGKLMDSSGTPSEEPDPRPYIRVADRRNANIARRNLTDKQPAHVDFTVEETDYLCLVVKTVGQQTTSYSNDPMRLLLLLMLGKEALIPRISISLQRKLSVVDSSLGQQLLLHRKQSSIIAFLQDAANGRLDTIPQAIVQIGSNQKTPRNRPRSQLSLLLSEREMLGMAPPNAFSRQLPFKMKAMSHLEDSLVRQSEWIDCCGDISAISWTGENTFVCGATAHSDFHNMQYNKPGNLLVGSLASDTLRALPDHRIVRPLVAPGENVENAQDSMRQTQDPWLYTSVVATAHSEINGFTFTASFDKTVKIWVVSETGSSMDLVGTWAHEDKVNFVVTSEHHDRVATAADVCNNAIRVYAFDEQDINNSPYDTYSGLKAQDQARELRRRDTWAYFPATIQWGKSHSVSHLLLVGYSPRSVTGEEVDIPDDKRNSGELCVWNVENQTRISITSGRTQNVFEVMWHPTQPIFLAATSPCGIYEPETRTQIRLFAQNEHGAFLNIKALDCPALDINELTLMPNSILNCYVTASCTDGNTYVWDTARGDKAIHILSHGDSLDNPLPELPREVGDAGVKFASWGQSSDRFYTGSSDGKLKAWDIRAPPNHAFVRDVLELSGGISAGAFSKDFSKLLIGDATGKVHFLSFSESSEEFSILGESSRASKHNIGLGIAVMTRGRPKVVIPHPEPPAPSPSIETEAQNIELSGKIIGRQYIEEGQLRLHPHPAIGAVKGPNYHEIGFYRLEAHRDQDKTKPLLPEFQMKQQEEIIRELEDLRITVLPHVTCSDKSAHSRNVQIDMELKADGIELEWEYSGLEKEMAPQYSLFREEKAKRVERGMVVTACKIIPSQPFRP